ncbi:alpha-ketoglutarate-dependent dioxygenase alkB homolog 7, mitochondrial-like [Clytia hemisphaerica]|uniref:alpha-ketoglutarate-dependent dioxygenase alkB homolog 7, mitochondrial-like n=1 Tax=Clytia hemisphaerica TaxID=252671 RepID=UPI0034D46A5F
MFSTAFKLCRKSNNQTVGLIRRYSSLSNVSIFNNENAERGDYLKNVVEQDFTLIENFITEKEEDDLMKEIEKAFRRTRYQYDHWDGAIHGFRETEKSNWNTENMKIFENIKNIAFDMDNDIIPTTHVLDLAEDGLIKPHVDSIKFCGNKIAGLNLLSDAIMRYGIEKEPESYIDVYLPRFSLYIMRDALRFDFTHEVLANKDSYFQGKHIQKNRRVSILHRNEPS